MLGRTHLVGGLLAGLAVSGVSPAPLVTVVFATLAGPLPDVDHPDSMYGRFVPLPGVVVSGGRLNPWFPGLGQPRGRVGRRFGGRRILWHRGPTHSLVAAAVFAGVSWLAMLALGKDVALSAAIGAAAGYVSHLVLDLFNTTPLMLWWPLSRQGVIFPAPRIQAGGHQEFWLTVAMGSGVLWILAKHVLAWFG